MEKKIFYWSPHINEQVATVKAVLNSTYSLSRYSDKYKPFIINAFGEWNNFSSKLESLNISSIQIFNFNIKLPINGFIKSRLFYIFFSLIVFFPLIKMIKKEKPAYVIIHLITIPVLIAAFFLKGETKFILRISGFPKLNIFRSFLWKMCSKKIFKVFSPTLSTMILLKKRKIFEEKKIFLLEDPIIRIRSISKLKRMEIDDDNKNMNYIVSIGRLTKQKNFNFLIKSFSKVKEKLGDIKLIIIGSGEEKENLKKQIKIYGMEKHILLKEFKNNIFNYIYNSRLFVLTSNWEDPGFVIIEAAACNKLILSSNAESGPIEFVGNDQSGLIFKKNNFEQFQEKLIFALKNVDEKKIYEIKKNAKLKVKKYTIFNHSMKLIKLLD